MGWSCSSTPTSMASAIECFTEGVSVVGARTTTVVRKAARGMHVWLLLRAEAGESSWYEIALLLLKRGRGEWCSKLVSEFDGPAQTSCPLSFLDYPTRPMDPERDRYALDWRQKVRGRKALPTAGDLQLGHRYWLQPNNSWNLRGASIEWIELCSRRPLVVQTNVGRVRTSPRILASLGGDWRGGPPNGEAELLKTNLGEVSQRNLF